MDYESGSGMPDPYEQTASLYDEVGPEIGCKKLWDRRSYDGKLDGLRAWVGHADPYKRMNYDCHR